MQVQDNKKQHKINSKLRKKRQQLKQHKKQKKITKQKYNSQDAKMKFFQQSNTARQAQHTGSKLRNLQVWLYRFIKVFDDDMEDFYDIWRNLDEGGEVNIEDIQNEEIKNILNNICKYLPVTKIKQRYVKEKDSKVNLGSYVKIKTQQILEQCLERDTLSQYAQSEDELEEEKRQRLTKIKQFKKPDVQEITIKMKPLKKQQVPMHINSIKTSMIPEVLRIIPKQKSSSKHVHQKRNKEDQIDKIFNKAKNQLTKDAKDESKISPQLQNIKNTQNDHEKKNNQSLLIQNLPNWHLSINDTKYSQHLESSTKKSSKQRFDKGQTNKVDLPNLKQQIKSGYLFNFPNETKPSFLNNKS